MSARLSLRLTVPRGRSVLWRYTARATLISIALLTQGCATDSSRVFRAADPSDPNVRVPPTGYRPVLGDHFSGRPVEPAPWSQLNDGSASTPAKDGQ